MHEQLSMGPNVWGNLECFAPTRRHGPLHEPNTIITLDRERVSGVDTLRQHPALNGFIEHHVARWFEKVSNRVEPMVIHLQLVQRVDYIFVSGPINDIIGRERCVVAKHIRVHTGIVAVDVEQR
jgi:hypothetical protein